MRKQNSALRLQEFQQRRRIFLLWRRVLHKIARSWRHERLWRVHNAWYATRSTSADSAEPPAPEAERMEVDRGTKRAADPVEPEQPLRGSETRPPSGGGMMNPSALEFVPGRPQDAVSSQPAVVEDTRHDLQVYEREDAAARARRRLDQDLRWELRRARVATRKATEAAEAAVAAKHNADAIARAAQLTKPRSASLALSPRRKRSPDG